jgi:tetratricopeptide (TPR) repeat protein
VVALVERALSKKPGERFTDAGAMAATLRRVQESLPSSLVEEGPGPLALAEAEETLMAEGGATRTMPTVNATAVAGATALAPDPMGQGETLVSTTVRPSATAVGAATQTGTRRWLWVGGAFVLLVVALGAVAWLALRRAPSSLTPGEAAEESVGILTDALVSSQVELAREDINNRDYEAAVQRVERALELAPGNPEAEEVLSLARRTLEERDVAVQSARSAFEAGDLEGATQALSQVISLDPRNPVVDELSGALNERFRQQAEAAREQARRARAAAAAEQAGEVEAFSVAGGLEREAATLFRQEEYTSAAQKWIEARDAFDGARRAARIARATPPPTPVPATPTPPVARVSTPPPRPATPPPATLAPEARTSVNPAPARTAPAREASAAVTPATEPAPAVVPTSDPQAAVREVLSEYERVFETKNLDLYRSIKVAVSPREEEGLRKAFKQIDDQQLDLTIHEVEFVGDDRAVVRTSRHDILDGDERPPMKQVFHLVRSGGRWRIESFEFPR